MHLSPGNWWHTDMTTTSSTTIHSHHAARLRRAAALAILAIAVLALAACEAVATPTPPPTPTQPVPQPGRTLASVVRVVDGDTIVVNIDGEEHTVRYIGIDTPETVHPSRPVQEFGIEASNRNKELVEGKQVWLEKDVSETDQFGRLLRYVWLDETTMVNAVLVSEGLAQVSTFPPDVKHTDLFIQLQNEARDNRAGMWVDFDPTPTSGDCDPAYPTVCLPSPPPDLNCGDITERRFQVLAPDPHHFDTDGDGIACES